MRKRLSRLITIMFLSTFPFSLHAMKQPEEEQKGEQKGHLFKSKRHSLPSNPVPSPTLKKRRSESLSKEGSLEQFKDWHDARRVFASTTERYTQAEDYNRRTNVAARRRRDADTQAHPQLELRPESGS